MVMDGDAAADSRIYFESIAQIPAPGLFVWDWSDCHHDWGDIAPVQLQTRDNLKARLFGWICFVSKDECFSSFHLWGGCIVKRWTWGGSLIWKKGIWGWIGRLRTLLLCTPAFGRAPLFSADLGIHLLLIGSHIHHHRAQYTSLVRKYGQTFTCVSTISIEAFFL